VFCVKSKKPDGFVRMMDNIIASKLYRPGSVGYVSKSGGMSNELNNILSIVTNGTYEGIAIGGDRYPGSTFIDHLLRYERDTECKMLVLLGEVGGIDGGAVWARGEHGELADGDGGCQEPGYARGWVRRSRDV